MITRLDLENYRCFASCSIPLRPFTAIVGRNNAGKSTIVEALRLVAMAVEGYGRRRLEAPPAWAGLSGYERVTMLDLRNIEFELDTIFNNYGPPPAHVRAMFATGESVEIVVGEGGTAAARFVKPSGNAVSSNSQAHSSPFPAVAILPQIGPLLQSERVLSRDYVRRTVSTPLSSLHFRNELRLEPDSRRAFEELVQHTWHEIRVVQLDEQLVNGEQQLSLIVREADFASEIGRMGHGLQMWLQTMWFLAKCQQNSTIILDEPDVYLHADLQRRLVHVLRSRYKQVIIATHSVEMLAELEPDEVLHKDMHRNEHSFVASLPGLQGVAEGLGSVGNLQLMRLWTAKRLLLVEGNDVSLLARLQRGASSDRVAPVSALPSLGIGGWGAWRDAVGAARVVKNVMGDNVRIYCILDSDFHTDEELSDRTVEAAEKGIQLHIWRAKELENYLVVASAIQRTIATELGTNVAPSITEVEDAIDSFTEELKIETTDSIANAIKEYDRRLDIASANRAAREKIELAWATREGRCFAVSGKKLLSKLTAWSKEEYNVHLSATKIASNLRPYEIYTEVQDVLRAIERNEVLPSNHLGGQ